MRDINGTHSAEWPCNSRGPKQDSSTGTTDAYFWIDAPAGATWRFLLERFALQSCIYAVHSPVSISVHAVPQRRVPLKVWCLVIVSGLIITTLSLEKVRVSEKHLPLQTVKKKEKIFFTRVCVAPTLVCFMRTCRSNDLGREKNKNCYFWMAVNGKNMLTC